MKLYGVHEAFRDPDPSLPVIKTTFSSLLHAV